MSMDAFAAQVGSDIRALRQRTGWRNLTHANLTAGKVQVARTGNLVEMIWDGAVFGTLTGDRDIVGLIPAGFVIAGRVWQPFTTVPIYGPSLGCRLHDSGSVAPGTVQIFGLTSGASLRAYASWQTADPWPAVLPGTSS